MKPQYLTRKLWGCGEYWKKWSPNNNISQSKVGLPWMGIIQICLVKVSSIAASKKPNEWMNEWMNEKYPRKMELRRQSGIQMLQQVFQSTNLAPFCFPMANRRCQVWNDRALWIKMWSCFTKFRIILLIIIITIIVSYHSCFYRFQQINTVPVGMCYPIPASDPLVLQFLG